ncbi:hypothetical protein F7725_017851 [Dissostichus mawsoni]|uniref:Ig-like domain-containing protein n=1 Tax=Dissostichus mawsoni TaxID=36200 RepID=A0A7J5XPW4_DISMA|nr:hypothetical protein F7725_017851 [Dissostichus mawsoni]
MSSGLGGNLSERCKCCQREHTFNREAVSMTPPLVTPFVNRVTHRAASADPASNLLPISLSSAAPGEEGHTSWTCGRVSGHLELLNFTGSDRATSFIMNCAVILLLTSTCFTSSALYVPNRAVTSKLKYLLEPPVYAEVVARRGQNATLPCILRTKPRHYKVKWTKLEPENVGRQNIIMISNAQAYKPASVSPEISQHGRLAADQKPPAGRRGKYRCELVNGIEDESVDGTVHYPIIQPRPACEESCSPASAVMERKIRIRTAELALVGHLYSAWRFQNYDRCDGGWLRDGSVRFPISNPRELCGGIPEAGVRSFGFPNKMKPLFGAYCYM